MEYVILGIGFVAGFLTASALTVWALRSGVLVPGQQFR